MYVTQTRDQRSSTATFYREYRNGKYYRTMTSGILPKSVGIYQSIYGWRSDPRKPVYYRDKKGRLKMKWEKTVTIAIKGRNPHSAVISREEQTCNYITPDKALKSEDAYSNRVEMYGFLAPAIAKLQLPNLVTKPASGLTAAQLRTKDRAILATYAAAKQPVFDGLTNLGELGETIAMLVSPLNGIRSLLKKVVTKPKRSFRRRFTTNTYREHVMNQWLEYRYGIMPLIYTCQDLCQLALNQVNEPGELTLDFRELKKLPSSKTQTVGTTTWLSRPFTYVHTVEERFKAGCSLAARLNLNVNRRLGFRLSDVPSSAFELAPLSFVGDWFFNFSDWIRAMTPDPQVSILSSSVSTKRTVIKRLDFTSFRSDLEPLTFTPITGHYYQIQWEDLTRVANPTLPSLPVYDDSRLSWKRKLDGISLLHGSMMKSINKIMR